MFVLGIIYESKPNIVTDIQMAFMKRQKEDLVGGMVGKFVGRG